jgi:hypothetical protein
MAHEVNRTVQEVDEMLGFPQSVPPTGWFQIGWSEDLPAGTVKALQIFGTEVIM